MLTFICEFHYWTLKNDLTVSNTDFSHFRYVQTIQCFLDPLGPFHHFINILICRYNEKKEAETTTDKIIKRNYVEARGCNWVISNKRPVKLRESLKHFEVSNLYSRLIHL